MTKVQLSGGRGQRDFGKYLNIASAGTDCDCDCACPIDDFDIPTLDMPTFYSLELTPVCNSRCAGCSNVFIADKTGRTPASGPLPFAKWQEILDIIAPYAARLKITGGEPTLHPEFELIIEAIEDRNIPFTLFTNARWRHPQKTVDFLQAKKSCAGLLISLHGAKAEIHESFTGVKGSFAEILPNIQLATEAGISVHISSVFTAPNLEQAEQIEEIVALAKQLGAGATVFNRYIGRPLEGISPTTQQLQRAIKQVERLRNAGEDLRFGVCIPQCFIESTATACLAGKAYCTIDPWGNMRPCNHAPWITGNILRDSLRAAWHSAIMERWRSLIPTGCAACSLFAQCGAGCRAEAILNGLKQDPLMLKPTLVSLEAVAEQFRSHLETRAKANSNGVSATQVAQKIS